MPLGRNLWVVTTDRNESVFIHICDFWGKTMYHIPKRSKRLKRTVYIHVYKSALQGLTLSDIFTSDPPFKVESKSFLYVLARLLLF